MNTSLFTIFGCLFIVLLAPLLKAQTHSNNVDAYQHLFEVNKEWKHFRIAAPAQKVNFTSDTKRIRFHLESVIAHLSKLEPINRTKLAQKKRQKLLDKLKNYAEQEVFPQNIYHANRQPYFIDHKGTHCAVGYLMKESGAGDLAKTISKEHNYDYIADIKTKGVSDWAEEHGFLLEELAWIQPGYALNRPFEALGKGTNGPVHKMIVGNDKLYFAGDFDLVDSLPCLNIGVYEMGQLSCLGNGIDGKINDIAHEGQTIIVGDLIDPAGNHVPVAIYDDATNGWIYHAIPGRSGAEGMVLLETSWNYKLEVAITDPSIIGTEIWEYKAGVWKLNCTIHGELFDLYSVSAYFSGVYYPNNEWYVGLFDSITIHRTGMADTLFYSHNIIAVDGFNNLSFSANAVDTILPDTIQVITGYGANVYLGGHSHHLFKPLVMRFLNGSFQTLIFEYELTEFWWSANAIYPKVLDISPEPNTGNLFIAGKMKHDPLNGTYWNSVLKYDVGTSTKEGYNVFDSTITSVEVLDGDLIIGGPFTRGVGGWATPQLNYLAKLQVPTTIYNLKDELEMKLFPNPTNDEITIDLGVDYMDANVEISNALGQLIYQEEYTSINSIHLSLEGNAGVYLVKVKTEEAESIVKVVKY